LNHLWFCALTPWCIRCCVVACRVRGFCGRRSVPGCRRCGAARTSRIGPCDWRGRYWPARGISRWRRGPCQAREIEVEVRDVNRDRFVWKGISARRLRGTRHRCCSRQSRRGDARSHSGGQYQRQCECRSVHHLPRQHTHAGFTRVGVKFSIAQFPRRSARPVAARSRETLTRCAAIALTAFASYVCLILDFLSGFAVFSFFWWLPTLREGVFADLLDLAEDLAEESDARVLAGSLATTSS
jgi:hypothetical protein